MIFDQMPPLAGVSVIVALMSPVRFRWDHSGRTVLIQFFQEPIHIKCLVCQQRAVWSALHQRSRALHVVRLPGQQQEADEIAERTDQGDNPGRQAIARAMA